MSAGLVLARRGHDQPPPLRARGEDAAITGMLRPGTGTNATSLSSSSVGE